MILGGGYNRRMNGRRKAESRGRKGADLALTTNGKFRRALSASHGSRNDYSGLLKKN